MSFRAHFSRFLSSMPERLHFASHSHHPWPDVTFEAQQEAWLTAAAHHDDKWDVVFSRTIPQAQRLIADELGLPSTQTIVFAPNTHELVVRLLSCLPPRPTIVTTDSEFHSFERQTRRLEEEGLAQVSRVAAEPFDSFAARLVDAAQARTPDLVFFSHVFFNSGAIVSALDEVISALPKSSMVVVDGYHGFCAVPTSLGRVHSRCFYLAGGYKYAMAGEGVCFAHAPAGVPLRPRNTGWFAAFGALDAPPGGPVAYAEGAGALWGATFDPTGLFRFNAAMALRARVGLTTATNRSHAHALQHRFVNGLSRRSLVSPDSLVVSVTSEQRGQFLTFRSSDAREVCATLKARRVTTDARGDRLRVGFGCYHDAATVDALLERLDASVGV